MLKIRRVLKKARNSRKDTLIVQTTHFSFKGAVNQLFHFTHLKLALKSPKILRMLKIWKCWETPD